MSWPSLRAWQEGSALRSAAGEVTEAMLSARTRSIVERRNYTVRVDYATDTYLVTPAGGGAQQRLGAPWTTVDLYYDDSDPECPPLTGETVVFRPNGTADAAGFEGVYLRSSGDRVAVRYRVKVLGATGKVGLERWSGGTWTAAF
jgi:hypothetical protein